MERQHRAPEAEIVEARAHPSIDHLQIVELKRRKLLVGFIAPDGGGSDVFVHVHGIEAAGMKTLVKGQLALA